MSTRSIAREYGGLLCPEQYSFSYVHGPSAATASVRFPGEISPPLGTPIYLYAGMSIWYGFIVDTNYDTASNTTQIAAVDWRDRLADIHVAAAYNCQDEDGRWYHILAGDWQAQRRTYLSRELDQMEFFRVQELPASSVISNTIARNNIFSAYTLLNYLAQTYRFRIYADTVITRILKMTYPPNLDWNGGARVIDAVQQILDKCGLQLACVNIDDMYLTMRGNITNPFMAAFLAGQVDYCDIGANSARIGQQFSDKGRRVVLLGDRNRKEFIFACKANWNPKWTWELAYGGFALGSLLESLGLTLRNKLKELPAEWHDGETWTEANDLRGKGDFPLKRSRNEMTIEEYLEKIVFKAYVVSANYTAHGWESSKFDGFFGTLKAVDRNTLEFTGETGGMTDYDRTGVDWRSRELNFKWPISQKLPTESNLQFLVHCTSRRIIQGVDNPFFNQLSFVPQLGGSSVDVEEVLSETGSMEYRVRVFFNEPQFYMRLDIEDITDPAVIQPDLVLVRLSLDTDLYTWVQGDRTNTARVREQKVNVPNLSKAFLNNEEIRFLGMNFIANLASSGVAPASRPMQANDIAKSIATQLLYRSAIQHSGDLVFYDRCGTLPDGIIESVTVDWNRGAIQETVNFGTAIAERREIIPPTVLRMAYKFLDETELNRRRLLWAARIAMAELRGAAAGEDPGGDTLDTFAGGFAPHKAMSAYSKDGVVAVRYSSEAVEETAYIPGDVIVTRGAREAGVLT